MDIRPKLLLIGCVPPPLHGAAMCMKFLIDHRQLILGEIVHLDSRFTSSSKDLGVVTLHKIWLLFGYLKKLLALLCFNKLDMVVVSTTAFFKPFLKDALFIWLSRLCGKPVSAWLHNDPDMFLHWRPWQQKFGALTFARLDFLIIISEKLVTRCPSWCDRTKIFVLNNGVDIPEDIAPEEGKKLDRGGITYLSSMDEAKGWVVLLRAAVILAKRGILLNLNFYGPAAVDPDSGLVSTNERIHEKMAEAQAEGVMAQWYGAVTGDEKWKALTAASLFVFPSHSAREAFPLAVLEAMGCGLPIVATNVGGVSDVLVGEQAAFVVEPNNDVALADAIERIMVDEDLRLRLSMANRASYLENYSINRYIERWNEFLGAWFAMAEKA